MSQSNIVQRRSSPFCIGCIVILVILMGFTVALGVYVYRFVKGNISLVKITEKTDPPLDTPGSVLLPVDAGEFKRIELTDSLDSTPNLKNLETSGVQVGIYEDPNRNRFTVIAISTADAKNNRSSPLEKFGMGASKNKSVTDAISVKDVYTNKGTITTWSRPNWTFMVQTTSALTTKFMEDFQPGTTPENEAELITTGTKTTTEDSKTSG